MMKRYSQLLLGVVLLFLFSLIVFVGVGANPLIAEDKTTLQFSGTLEARQTHIAAEVSAHAVRVAVAKGSVVNPGDILIGLDDTSVKGTLAEAESAVRAAKANLDQVKEQARPGNIALAEANIKQAQADVDGAKKALADANRALAMPQDLTAQMHMWEGKASASEGEVAAAQANLASIKVQLDKTQNDQSMAGKYQFEALEKQQEAGQASLAAAQISLDGNRRVLELFRQLVANPLELVAAQHAAEKQVKIAESGLKAAQAGLDVVRRSAQPEAVALAQAKLDAATANLSLLQALAKRYAITSPVSGTVVDRAIDLGETTRPGTTLVTIADTTEFELMLYVPIRNLSSIRVGQTAKIYVPSVPSKAYQATVTYISPEAEFKPANLYNSKDRSEVVFSVRLTVPNVNNELKAGLPADASFE